MNETKNPRQIQAGILFLNFNKNYFRLFLVLPVFFTAGFAFAIFLDAFFLTATAFGLESSPHAQSSAQLQLGPHLQHPQQYKIAQRIT